MNQYSKHKAEHKTDRSLCEPCEGTGSVQKRPCPNCQGYGWVISNPEWAGSADDLFPGKKLSDIKV